MLRGLGKDSVAQGNGVFAGDVGKERGTLPKKIGTGLTEAGFGRKT